MPCKVFTLLNEKGGVGKTTLAVHIAAGLAALGYRVLLVDADPQGSATMALGLEPFGGLYRYLVQDAEPNDIITVVSPEIYALDIDQAGFLGVIRSNVETRNIANTVSGFKLFHQRIQELAHAFDIVVVDTSPTPSLLHATILIGTDYVIMPTQLETSAIDSLHTTVSHLQEFYQQRVALVGEQIGLVGIIPTQAMLKTVEHTENLKELQKEFGEFVRPPIQRRIGWAEATTYRVPVWNLPNGGGLAAKDAWQMVNVIRGIYDAALKA